MKTERDCFLLLQRLNDLVNRYSSDRRQGEAQAANALGITLRTLDRWFSFGLPPRRYEAAKNYADKVERNKRL